MSINSLSNSNLTGTQNKNIRQAQVDQSIKSNQFQIEYLIVGGGGGGGFGGHGTDQRGGGGGGGGFRNSTEGEETGYPATTPESKFLATLGTSYTVTVGAGGSAHANGSNSVFATLDAMGGGRGGQHHYGFAGGTRRSGSHAVGSGGGGQAGSYGAANVGGCGSWQQGAAGANNHGSSVTYSEGKTSQAAHTGSANSGDGGGGGTGANVSGSAGGSGIVVLKYLTKEATITVGGSLTSSSTTSGEFTIVTFTA